MYPVIHFLGRELGSYGLCAGVGALLAGLFLCLVARKRKQGTDDINIVLMLVIGVGVLVGSHVLYALVTLPAVIRAFFRGYTITSFMSVVEVVATLFGGAVFYGGLGGGGLAALLYVNKKKLDRTAYADMLAPAIPLFHTFGRIGCFLGGCCYGIESEFGFMYTINPIEQANGVVRFPVQLVEAGFNLVLFLVLAFLLHKGLLRGRLLLVYLLSYAPARFILEFLRGDTYRGLWWGLSTSQWISLFIVVGCLAFLAVQKLRPRQPAAEA